MPNVVEGDFEKLCTVTEGGVYCLLERIGEAEDWSRYGIGRKLAFGLIARIAVILLGRVCRLFPVTDCAFGIADAKAACPGKGDAGSGNTLRAPLEGSEKSRGSSGGFEERSRIQFHREENVCVG